MDSNDQNERLGRVMEQLARAGSADLDGVRQDMRERGEDPDEVRKRGIAFVRRLKGRLRLSRASQQREETVGKLEQLRTKVRQNLEKAGQSVEEVIRRLKARSDADLSVSFRKVESLDKEEALDLLTEEQLLDILEEMNKSK